MTSLRELARQAMLGTSSGFVAPQNTVNWADLEPESALLVSAVMAGTAEIAGQILPRADSLPPACENETGLYLPDSALVLLRRMLAGEYNQVLFEFLSLAAAKGFIVQPEILPSLFGLNNSDLRTLVRQVSGARGAWLARQNPAWAYAVEREPQDGWENGTRAERIAAIGRLHELDPEMALTWIQATWAQDSADERTAFLGALGASLVEADEPFLERCLDDRRKEVRAAARVLLVRLPESRFVQRTWLRARALVKIKSSLFGGDHLDVILPDAPDAAARRDGVGELVLHKKIAEKADLLIQHLALVPPSHWSQTFGKPPDRLISLALAGEWREPVLLGWQQAAQYSLDQEWAEALAFSWVNRGEVQKIIDSLDDLVKLVRLEKLEEFMRSAVRPGSAELKDERLVTLLQKFQRPWSASLARLVLRSLQRQSSNLPFSPAYALPGFAHWIPPQLASEFERGWADEMRGYGPDHVFKFTELLNFRYAVYQSLLPAGELQTQGP